MRAQRIPEQTWSGENMMMLPKHGPRELAHPMSKGLASWDGRRTHGSYCSWAQWLLCPQDHPKIRQSMGETSVGIASILPPFLEVVKDNPWHKPRISALLHNQEDLGNPAGGQENCWFFFIVPAILGDTCRRCSFLHFPLFVVVCIGFTGVSGFWTPSSRKPQTVS